MSRARLTDGRTDPDTNDGGVMNPLLNEYLARSAAATRVRSAR